MNGNWVIQCGVKTGSSGGVEIAAHIIPVIYKTLVSPGLLSREKTLETRT